MRIAGSILIGIGLIAAGIGWYVNDSSSGKAARVAAIKSVSAGWLSDSPTPGKRVLIEGKAQRSDGSRAPLSKSPAAYWWVKKVHHFVEQDRVCETVDGRQVCTWEDVEKTRELPGEYQDGPLGVQVGKQFEVAVDVPHDEDAVERLEETASRESERRGGVYGSAGDEFVESTEFVLRPRAPVVLIGKIASRGDSVTVAPVNNLPLIVRGTRANLEKSLATNAARGRVAMYAGLVLALIGSALLGASFLRTNSGDLDSGSMDGFDRV